MPKSDGWKNLQPLNGKDPEREREVRQKGAAAGREIQKKRKALRDIMDVLLALPAGNELFESDITEAAKVLAMEHGETLTAYDAVSLAQIAKAAKGDTEAARWVRDSAGDKPTEKQQIVADVVTPADAEIAKRVAERLAKVKESE